MRSWRTWMWLMAWLTVGLCGVWPHAAHATSCAVDGDTTSVGYKDCIPARVMWSSWNIDQSGKQEFFNTPQDAAAAFYTAWSALNPTYCTNYQCYVAVSSGYVNGGQPGAPPILMSYNFVIKTVLPPSLFSTTLGLSNITVVQSSWCPVNYNIFSDVVVGTPNYGAVMCRPVAGIKAARALKGDLTNPAGCTHGCNPVDLGDMHKMDWVVDYQNQSPYPIVWARSYNGLSHQWFFNYDRKLIASTYSASLLNATATLRRQDGQLITFTGTRTAPSSAWVWAPNVGTPALSALVLGTLTSANDLSSFTFVNHQDETESYNAAGQLTQIQDTRALPLTFAYDTRGRLSQVTDASSRSLAVTYPTVVAPSSGTYNNGTGGSSSATYVTYLNGNNSWVESFPDTVSDGTRNIGYAWIIQPNSPAASPALVLSQVIKPDTTTLTYNYDSTGQYLGLTDENGARYSTYTYGSSDTVTQTYHGNQVETVNYAQGSVTFPNGQAMTYGVTSGTYKSTGQTTACAWCGGTQASSLQYDAAANPTTMTDFDGNTETRTYDQTRGVPTSVTEASGSAQARTITTTWDSRFLKPTTVTRPVMTPQGAGTQVATDSYDNQGDLTAWSITVTGPNSYTLTRSGSATYNSFGEPLTITDARGNTSSATYDTQGNRLTATDALGHVTTYGSYDTAGNVGVVTDPNGLQTQFTYDANQRVTQIQRGCPSSTGSDCHWETTTITYDPMGKVAKVIGPEGRGLAYHYDTAHRLTQTDWLDTDGATVLGSEVLTLDTSSEVTQRVKKDGVGNVIQTQGYTYDALSRVTALVDSHNKSFAQTWDAQSNLATTQDPLTHGQVLAYDSLDRLTQTTLADNLVESQTYGPDDTVLSQTDAKGVTTTQAHNGFGEVVTRNSPDAGTLLFTRDANGNVLTRSDARGVVLTTTFDSLNRPLTQMGSTGGAAEQIAWAYDTCANGVGRLCTVTDGTGVTAFTYDRWGRVSSKTVQVFGQTLTVGYTYNAQGQRITITYPSGQVLTQTWAHGQVVSQQWGATPVFTAAQYDAWGKVQGWTWGSGRGFSLGYDLDGRVNAIGAGAGAASQTYSYDDAWRLTGITRQPANQTTTFGYDNRNRLTSGSTWGSYTYDGNSNRLTWLGALGPQSYTYGASNNTLTTWNSTAVAADAAGNLLNPQGLTLTFDDWNRLRTATPSGSTLVTYGVNGLNERVSSQQGTTQRIYLYASVGHLLGVYDGTTGLPVEELAYLGERPVATVRANQVDPIETDHLMAPLRVLDPSNTVLWSWEDREPFGASAPTSSSGFVLDLRFPGQWADEVTGLVSNGFRDYDPPEGRYVEVDPTGLSAGMNPYIYVDDRPLDGSDSKGLARFGYRPLSGLYIIPTFGVVTNVEMYLTNTVPAHEAIWYDDNQTENVGFYGTGGSFNKPGSVMSDPETGVSKDDYVFEPGVYDDNIMRKAVKNIQGQWDHQNYNVITRNCQDFVSAVKDEYKKLGGKVRYFP